jgi:cobalt-zinc-cadmium efflux system outer membrane protein
MIPLLLAALSLTNVLDSVERHYPPLIATLAERDIADAELLQALGKFDLTLRAGVQSDQLGYYSNERFYTGFEQPTQTWGSSFYGGYRVGRGTFAPYDGKLQTRTEGEWSGGLKLPLWRDRALDEKRASLRKAELGRALARLTIDQQKLVIIQMATRRYWDWVAAGRRLKMAEAMLSIAQARDELLRRGAKAGQIPPIEVAENQRAILQRKSQVVEGTRFLQQAAIDLSLFYRDNLGKPVLATDNQVPDAFPDLATIEDAQVAKDLESAVSRRPDLARFSVQKAQTEIDRRMALNDARPAIDLGLGFTAESGAGPVRRGPRELKAALNFELPYQRRAARGKEASAAAKLRQLDQRERFTEDQIVAEVRDAVSAVRTAFERAQLTREEYRVARDLEEAERARFRLGDGTMFLVNLREQATFDAALRELSATQDYFRSRAQYELSIAAALR